MTILMMTQTTRLATKIQAKITPRPISCAVSVASRWTDDRQQAPHADHAVHRDGTDRIVDLQLVQGDDGEHHDHATDGTDQGGQQRCRGQRLGGDRHQTGQRAVQRHGQVSLAEQQAGTASAATTPPAAAMLVLTNTSATALASPTSEIFSSEPPLKPNQPIHRIKVPSVASGRLAPGIGLTGTVGAVLALACTEQQYTGQCRGCTAQMHDAGTGEVKEAQRIKTAAAPFPVSLHRVDEAGHDHGKHQEGPQLHALGHGAGDDGHRGCHEHDLEEEVGQSGVVGLTATGEHIGGRIVTAAQDAADTRPPGI